MTPARAGAALGLLLCVAGAVAHAEQGEPQHLRSRLEVMAGPELVSRRFEYRDEWFDRLPAYELRAAPALRALLRISPSTFAPEAGLEPLQVYVGGEYGLGLQSNLGDDTIATSTHAWGAGLRLRLPLEAHELAAEVGYGQHAFSFVGESPRDPEGELVMPSVGYDLVRWGLEARAELDRAILGVHVGHRVVLATGDIGGDAWFPELEAAGIDLGVLAGWAFADELGVLLSVQTRRYWYRLQPAPDAGASLRNQVAGGAVDVHTTWWLALCWWLDPERAPVEEEDW